jgi:hypothetical protein
LRQLQEGRKRKAQARLDRAARAYILAVHEERHEAFEPAELGFEFLLAEIELRAMDLGPISSPITSANSPKPRRLNRISGIRG